MKAYSITSSGLWALRMNLSLLERVGVHLIALLCVLYLTLLGTCNNEGVIKVRVHFFPLIFIDSVKFVSRSIPRLRKSITKDSCVAQAVSFFYPQHRFSKCIFFPRTNGRLSSSEKNETCTRCCCSDWQFHSYFLLICLCPFNLQKVHCGICIQLNMQNILIMQMESGNNVYSALYLFYLHYAFHILPIHLNRLGRPNEINSWVL